MTPQEHALLERALALAEENNRLLLNLRRAGRVAIGMRVLYWVIILGLTFGAFYFIQPYVNFFTNLTGSLNPGAGQTSGTNTSSSTDSSLLETLRQAQESARGLEKLLR